MVTMMSVESSIMQQSYTTWQVLEEYIPEEQLGDYRRLFKRFDRKNTGVLRIMDVVEIFRELGYMVTEKEIDHMLRNIIGVDVDCRKTSINAVDFQEFIAIISMVVTNCIPEDEMYLVFRQFDVNGDGFITADKLRTVLSRLGDEITDEEINKMIIAADADGDGQVSYQEFVRFLTNSVEEKSNQSSTPNTTCQTSKKNENNEPKIEKIDEVFVEKSPKNYEYKRSDVERRVTDSNTLSSDVKQRRSWFSKSRKTYEKNGMKSRMSCPALLNSVELKELQNEKHSDVKKGFSFSNSGSFLFNSFKRKNKRYSQ